jgi:hypothetical protein
VLHPCRHLPNFHSHDGFAACRYLNIGNQTQLDHVLSKWDEYFVFGFARNVSL